MPDKKTKSTVPTLTASEIGMLDLIASRRLIPWDPASLVRLQTLGLISKKLGDPDWDVTALGRTWLGSQGRAGG